MCKEYVEYKPKDGVKPEPDGVTRGALGTGAWSKGKNIIQK